MKVALDVSGSMMNDHLAELESVVGLIDALAGAQVTLYLLPGYGGCELIPTSFGTWREDARKHGNAGTFVDSLEGTGPGLLVTDGDLYCPVPSGWEQLNVQENN